MTAAAAALPSRLTRVMRSGARVDLADPAAASFSLRDIAEHLGCLSNDPATHSFSSIAQHSVRFAETANQLYGAAAALFALLHAAPAAVLGVLPPGVAEPRYMSLWERQAVRIHAAAGLSYPLTKPLARQLQATHARVELTELRCLRTGVEAEIAALEANGVEPLSSAVTVWPWHLGAERYETAWRKFAAPALVRALPTWCTQ